MSIQTKDIRDDAFANCNNVYDVNILEFDLDNISMSDIKKGHKMTIKVLKQVNRKKAERYARDHGFSTLFI